MSRRAGDDLLLNNVLLVHGRDACDEAGRPLTTYVCDYHQGYRDALDNFHDWFCPVCRCVVSGAHRHSNWLGDDDTD